MKMTPSPGSERQVLAVSELNRQAKRLLEQHFDQVWVQGEISNFARPQSGHWYFSLKDQRAQIRCAMFRNRNSRLRFQPKEGDEVVARGRLSIYEGRGDYQLIVENLQPAGAGALQLQLEELKARLQAEGLFDADAKRELPEHPQHIAVVTSLHAAALQDILSVFQRRAPQVVLSVYPVSVQGTESAPQLQAAVQALSAQGKTLPMPIDAIIIARGGGSLEDLWSFNDEALARLIAACPIPIVSAVGHETDFTICDLAADVRAPTPSAAAELLSPDTQSILLALGQLHSRLRRLMQQQLGNARRDLEHAQRLLRHPGRRLEDLSQRSDELSQRLERAIAQRLTTHKLRLQHRSQQLLACTPQHDLSLARARLQNSSRRLLPAVQTAIELKQAGLAHHSRMLNTVSPLATLDRGYAIVERMSEKGNEIVRDAAGLKAGDSINARVARGQIQATVTAISKK